MPPIRTTYHRHSPSRRDRVIGAVKAGLSCEEAGDQENVPIRTVQDLVKKYRETGSTADQPRTGRPRKVTDRTEREVIREVRKNRRKPLAEVGNAVEPPISDAAVRKILDAHGYHRRKGRKVQYLRPEHRRARLRWGKEHRGQNWDNVIWSDECYVYIGGTKGSVYVTRRADEVYHEDCVVPTFKQSNVRVMVWGCIMNGKKGPLVVLEYPGGKGSGMNSARYQEQVIDAVLADYYMQAKQTNPNVVFQQDNAASHVSNSTLKHLAHLGIIRFPHPASSPDLSPIEPLWGDLKRTIRARPHPPSSFAELKSAVLEAWESLTDNDVRKYTSRMDDRVDAVVAAKGGHIPF